MPVCDQFPRPSVETSDLNTQNDIEKDDNDGCCDINIVDGAGQHAVPQDAQSVVVNWNLGLPGLQHEVLWQQTEGRHSGPEEE